MIPKRIADSFFERDVLEVAPDLLGKVLVRVFPDGTIRRFVISETEAYRGEEDLACHASKGRTQRTDVMYEHGGVLYLYLIYGIHWMLNIVASEKNNPQAVLIRALEEVEGPGRLARLLELDKSFNREDLQVSDRIWIEDPGFVAEYSCHPRIGIDYAGDYWKNVPWRFLKASS